MIKVTITCPITWSERYRWITEHCDTYNDVTNWPAVMIGLEDIEIYLKEQDATLFHLRWG